MTIKKETAERLGALDGQGVAERSLKLQYSSRIDAALMMVSFALGLVAGLLL